MAIAFLHCPQPIRRRVAVAPRDYGRRDRAIELFDARRYRDAISETLAYLVPGQPVGDLAVDPLCLVQGSARVRARIEADALVLTSVLASLEPESQATAALRFMLTRLSATGQMFQPRLRGAVISLEFRDRLSLLHPLKLIEVLQRMPMEADRNDAWLVDRFGLGLSDREPIAPLVADELARAEEIWRTQWAAVDALMAESRRRRSVFFLDAVGSFAANQVAYALPLFGALRARLNEMADEFTDADEDPNKRESVLAKCIKAMKQVDSEELRRCLGHATYAINPLNEGTPSLLTSMLGGGQRMQNVGDLRAGGRYLEAAVGLVAIHLYLLAHHSWPAEVETRLREALDLAHEKPWRELADLLWNHAHATAGSFGSHGERGGDDEADAPTDAAPRYATVGYPA